MKKLLFTAALLIAAVPVFAQSPTWQGNGGCGTNASNDPLKLANFPTIDTTPGDYDARVWITDEMQKIQQQVANTPGNVKWAFPCAAQGEWANFQLHFKNTAGGSVTLNSVTINALTSGANSIPTSDEIVYAERYYNVQTASDANSVTGFQPDILVPAVDPYQGQTTNAFPITVAAGQTQSVWFDIWIPRTTVSGFYQGCVTATVGGSALSPCFPVVLAVWNFSIPATSTLQSMMGGEDLCPGYYSNGDTGCIGYPGSGGDAGFIGGQERAEVDLEVMLLDHRITQSGSFGQVLSNPLTNGVSNVWTVFNSVYGPLIAGTPTITTQTISGGHVSRWQYTAVSNNAYTVANINNWLTQFSTQGWGQGLLFAYSRDEPGPTCGNWTSPNTNAATYQGSTPPIPTLITADLTDATSCSGLNSLDLMVSVIDQVQASSSSASLRSTYNSWLAPTGGPSCAGCTPRTFGLYRSCDQHGCSGGGDASHTAPDIMLDQTALRNRGMQWLQYLWGSNIDLYYDTTYCWDQTCSDGAGHNDPGSPNNPTVYIYFSGGNGDGTLVYPGTTSYVGTTKPIPLPSIRLNLIRDGYQDWEYMYKLDQNNQHGYMWAQLTSVLTNAYNLTTSTTTFQAARAAMGNRLHQISINPFSTTSVKTRGRVP